MGGGWWVLSLFSYLRHIMARVVTCFYRGMHPTQLRKSTVGRLGIEHFLKLTDIITVIITFIIMVSNGCGEEVNCICTEYKYYVSYVS